MTETTGRLSRSCLTMIIVIGIFLCLVATAGVCVALFSYQVSGQ